MQKITNFTVDKETVNAIEVLKKHHINLSSFLRDVIKRKAEQLSKEDD